MLYTVTSQVHICNLFMLILPLHVISEILILPPSTKLFSSQLTFVQFVLFSFDDQDGFYITFYLSFFIVLSLLNTLVFHDTFLKHVHLVIHALSRMFGLANHSVFVIIEEYYQLHFMKRILPWCILLFTEYFFCIMHVLIQCPFSIGFFSSFSWCKQKFIIGVLVPNYSSLC